MTRTVVLPHIVDNSWWISSRSRSGFDDSLKPIQQRLLIPLAAVLLLLVSGFFLLLVQQQSDNLNHSSQKALKEVSRDLAGMVIEQSETLEALGQVLLKDREFLATLLRAEDREGLLADYLPLFTTLKARHGITHFYFMKPERVCLLRVHKPEKYGDRIDRLTMLEAERTGKTVAGLELGPLGTFTLRSVQPVYDAGKLIGYMELGKEIEDILARLHDKNGVEISMIILKKSLNKINWEAGMKMLGREADWEHFPEEALSYSSMKDFPVEAEEFVSEENHVKGNEVIDIRFSNRSWRVMAIPMMDMSGSEVGDLIVFLDITSSKAGMKKTLFIGACGAVLLLSGLLRFLFILLQRTDRTIINQQAELKEQEELFRSIVEGTPNCVAMFDHEGRYLTINTSGLQTMGWTEGDIIGKRFPEIWPKQSRSVVEEAVLATLQGKKNSFEADYLHPDGHAVTWWVILNPVIKDENSILRFVGISIDMTERKQAKDALKIAYAELELRVEERTAQLSVANAALTAEIAEHKRTSEEREKLQEHLNQSQKMDSVGRLAGGVAHDFNNMLGVILGHTEIALMEIEPDDPMFERMQAIRKAAEHSADLTRQLLTFARKQSVTPKILDLNKTVEESLNMLRRLIGENIDLAWLPATAMWKIKIDPSQIIQILVNLCVNARDALAGEGRRITIKTGRSTTDEISSLQDNEITLGEYVWIAVSDDGCGIDKETLTRLFEPFFTTKGIGKGTGLGLATVYGIVKQNNGFIKVYSESGKGTTFKIYFPRDKGDYESDLSYDESLLHRNSIVQNNTVSEISDPLRQKSLLLKETILLVEDEPGILEITTTMLKHLGYRVLSASTPKQAIEMADKYSEDINLVVTDVIMPEMNGRDMVEKIRTLYPQLKCLFMSGYTADIISNQGVLNQGVNFIQKPFSLEDIAVSVRDALDQQI